MGKTSNGAKARYNEKNYRKYTFYLRKDEQISAVFEAEKETKPVSVIVKNALYMYFKNRETEEI
jgi:hypothetical protein